MFLIAFVCLSFCLLHTYCDEILWKGPGCKRNKECNLVVVVLITMLILSNRKSGH